MRYPFTLKPDGKFFLVKFPDIPEAITQGETKAEAIAMAQEALETAMEFYFDESRAVPPPSKVKRGQNAVELPASLTAKILLLNTMIQQGVHASELARRMGTTRQDVQRLTNLKHSSKIDGISAALQALGKRLEINVA